MNSGTSFHHIYVEITNRCNLRCSFCAGTNRPQTDMSMGDFSAILPQIAAVTNQVSLHVLGEPLLHPSLPDMLELCVQNSLQVNVTTNGTLLQECRAFLLQAPGLRQINFSLQALASLPARAELLEQILDFSLRSVHDRPDLYINFRLWTLHSLHDTDFDPWTVQALARIGEFFGQEIGLPRGRKSVRICGRVYLHRDSFFSWPGDLSTLKRTTGFCHALSTHCAILADGTVCPCCLDADGALSLGNIHDSSLEQILDAPRAQAMRNGFKSGCLVETQCQHCLYCRRFTRLLKK